MPEPVTLTATILAIIANLPNVIAQDPVFRSIFVVLLAAGNYVLLDVSTIDIMGFFMSIPFTGLMIFLDIPPHYFAFPVISGIPASSVLLIIYAFCNLFLWND